MRACRGGAHMSSPWCGPLRSRRGNRMPSSRKNLTVLVALPRRFEGREHHAERGLHLGIQVECEGAIGQVEQAHGRPHLQLATARLVELATAHASLDEVQVRYRHRSHQTQQQPVVESGRVVDAILVKDEGAGQGASTLGSFT